MAKSSPELGPIGEKIHVLNALTTLLTKWCFVRAKKMVVVSNESRVRTGKPIANKNRQICVGPKYPYVASL